MHWSPAARSRAVTLDAGGRRRWCCSSCSSCMHTQTASGIPATRLPGAYSVRLGPRAACKRSTALNHAAPPSSSTFSRTQQLKMATAFTSRAQAGLVAKPAQAKVRPIEAPLAKLAARGGSGRRTTRPGLLTTRACCCRALHAPWCGPTASRWRPAPPAAPSLARARSPLPSRPACAARGLRLAGMRCRPRPRYATRALWAWPACAQLPDTPVHSPGSCTRSLATASPSSSSRRRPTPSCASC